MKNIKSIKSICLLLMVFVLTIAFMSTTALSASSTPTADDQMATPTASTIMVNGTVVSFDAYTINGNNYFKLRDLAYVLSRTENQFEVGWDSTNNTIIITSGKPYTAVGGELVTGSTSSKMATCCTSTVYIDGARVDLTAYTIKNNNYFKLRDVATALNFGVTYNNSTRTIGIDTATGCTADNNISSDSVEKRIKTALINKTSYLFKISGEYTFAPGAAGLKSYKDENGTTTYKQSVQWAQDAIKGGSSGYVIRIDEGTASMEDSTLYTCSLKTLGNNEGISLSIDSVKSNTSELHINGTIKGNTLIASEQVITAFYSPFTKSGFGTSASGQYNVGLADVPEEQWPPIPVKLSYSINDDKSVTLMWEDHNPSSLVGYYEIYRMLGVAKEYSKVATVSNCTTWTDSSNEVKVYNTMYDYYVITYSKTGIKSPNSNQVIFCRLD